MVINSDPCIAYLMKDNTLLLQILTIAHVYGHNDFFKNNRLFKEGTRAHYTVEMFKNHATRVREYISDPGIGYKKVEKILNAAHALKLQVSRIANEKIISDEEKREHIYIKNVPQRTEFDFLNSKRGEFDDSQLVTKLNKIPLEPEEDVLYFMMKYGKYSDWERDLVSIAREEALYFIPQIETKVMNEGWASYWHYNILNKLELPQGLHVEFLKRHNQVIKPQMGGINPYYVGFKIFEDLHKKYKDNPEKIFEVRLLERDQSFIRRYLTEELCKEMNLFSYKKRARDYVISEVADERGWKEIRNTLAKSVGMGGVPLIKVVEWAKKDNTLILEHVYDGRELELNYANETIKHLVDLWDGKVMLSTYLDNSRKIIICDERKKVTMVNA
jgi:stage V sporulation protein R